MESRTQRLARLARLLGQRQTSFEAQRTTLEAQARRIEDQRRMLLQTLDASIAAHGLYVDLLAGRMKRLDADTHRISALWNACRPTPSAMRRASGTNGSLRTCS